MAPDPADLPPTVTFWHLKNRFGRGGNGTGWFRNYMQRMVDLAGFPPPLPDMSQRRPGLIRGVTENSRWVRVAVDAWFDDFLPPEVAARLDEVARAAAAAEMDQAAFGLRLVGGRGE